MKLLAIFIRSSAWSLLAATGAGLASGAITTALLMVINHFIQNTPVGASAVVLFAVLCVLRLVAGVAAHTLLVRLSQNAIFNLRMNLCRRVLQAPLWDVEATGVARLTASFADDMHHVATAVVNLPYMFVNGVILTGCFIYLGWLVGPAVWGIVAALVIGAVSYAIATRWANFRLRRARVEQDSLFAHFRNLTAGAKELKLHEGRRDAFVQGLYDSADGVRRHNTAGITVYSAAANWNRLLFFVYVGLLVFGPWRVHDNPVLLGSYILVLLYMMAPLEAILNAFPYLAQADVAVSKIQALAESLTPENSTTAPEAAAAESWSKIEIRDLQYCYQNGKSRPFRVGPVSLELQPGSITFIVGGNGSGKTTLGKLITGLYRPAGGDIIVDGQTVTDREWGGYRARFSAVFSDFCLFDELLGIPPSRHQLAVQYLSELGLDDKVQITGGRLSTTDLSQGQRKRLALLVALLEDRPIYLFDEWAADQDPEFKEVFYRKILPDLRDADKALVVITHDDRYFDVADQLLKLEDGRSAAMVPARDFLSEESEVIH